MPFVYQDGQSLVSADTSCTAQRRPSTLPAQPSPPCFPPGNLSCCPPGLWGLLRTEGVHRGLQAHKSSTSGSLSGQAQAVSARGWIRPAVPSLLGRVWVWFSSRTQRARHSFRAEFPFESRSGLSGFCPGRALLAPGISQSKQRAEIRRRTAPRQKANMAVVAAGPHKSPLSPPSPGCHCPQAPAWWHRGVSGLRPTLSAHPPCFPLPTWLPPAHQAPRAQRCLLLPPAHTIPKPVGARPAAQAPQNPCGSQKRGRGQPLPSSSHSTAPVLPSPAPVGKLEREPRERSCVRHPCRPASCISHGTQGSSSPVPCPRFSPWLPQTAGTGLSDTAGPPLGLRWRLARGRLPRRRPSD